MNGTPHFDPVIACSILAADFARLGEEVRAVLDAGADWIHFDVMDNHYVPNLSIGPAVCEAIRPYAKGSLIDVHLMVEPVDELVPAFAKAGAGMISFHPEATRHVDRTIRLIREQGCQAGLVLNPATPLTWLEDVLGELDMVLLMSVNPGFGGQKFIPATMPKLQRVRTLLDQHRSDTGHAVRLEIDGGVKADNMAAIAAAGADTFVSGSAIFGAANYREVISRMRKEIGAALIGAR